MAYRYANAPDGHELYAQRQSTVETTFGHRDPKYSSNSGVITSIALRTRVVAAANQSSRNGSYGALGARRVRRRDACISRDPHASLAIDEKLAANLNRAWRTHERPDGTLASGPADLVEDLLAEHRRRMVP
jgi:hypothetical protein